MEKIKILIHPEQKLKRQGDLFGIFFEDLNHAADGGLYAEMVQNRSFEFDVIDNDQYNHLTAWESVERGNSVVQTHIESKKPLNDNNQHYLRVEVMTAGEGGGIRNIGYGSGMAIERNKSYCFSCFYRRVSKSLAPVIVRLENLDGTVVYAESIWEPAAEQWDYIECEMTAEDTDYEGRLVLLMEQQMIIDLDMISLFPKDTFMKRKNGMRKDIADMLKELQPAFMRFPGGCLVHIGSLDADDRNSMYRWKNTLGKIEERPARRNNWKYNQTFGLGYFEYFQFCEDIGAEPMPIIAAGYDPHYLRAVPLDQIQEWVDEALDLIEFANGDVDSKWGKMRAELGHKESFHLKYLGIGNEEVGDDFFERYEIILNAVKEKHPEIKVIGSAGPASSGSEFVKGWEQARRTATDFVDEHFYQCPEWFIANADRYMDYPADGPKAFLGEYASHNHTWFHALAEAAFMIGMEKAPGIGLACYAPLLCHVDYQNWPTNLLYYDNYQVFGTASYYIQKLFMKHQGTHLVLASDDMNEKEKEQPILTGMIAMNTEKAHVSVSDFVITDNESGEKHHISSFDLLEENNYQECLEIFGNHYSVEFTFEVHNGRLIDDLDGLNYFALEFARKDEDNKIRWVINGWQRLTVLNEICRGYPCDMGMSLYDPGVKKQHQASLCVDGNKITIYLDQVKYCEHQVKSAVPDKLYYSATCEGTETIIKVANLEAGEKEIVIELDKREMTEAVLYYMEDIPLEAKNSFEEPQKVSPQEKELLIVDGKLNYVFKGHSFGVIRVK